MQGTRVLIGIFKDSSFSQFLQGFFKYCIFQILPINSFPFPQFQVLISPFLYLVPTFFSIRSQFQHPFHCYLLVFFTLHPVFRKTYTQTRKLGQIQWKLRERFGKRTIRHIFSDRCCNWTSKSWKISVMIARFLKHKAQIDVKAKMNINKAQRMNLIYKPKMDS